MNFLAHLLLSGNDKDLMFGNFIADGVKGKAYSRYPDGVARGIILHRAIDAFTDDHPLVKEAKKSLFPDYGKFAGVIIDLFYDHFLALHWKRFHTLPLDAYEEQVHRLLTSRKEQMPQRIRRMYPYMVADKWLSNYRKTESIDRALQGMGRRFPFENPLHEAGKELNGERRDQLEKGFLAFFPKLSEYSEAKKKELCDR